MFAINFCSDSHSKFIRSFWLVFYLTLNQAVNFRFTNVSDEADMSSHIIF